MKKNLYKTYTGGYGIPTELLDKYGKHFFEHGGSENGEYVERVQAPDWQWYDAIDDENPNSLSETAQSASKARNSGGSGFDVSKLSGGLGIASTAMGHIQDFANNINVTTPQLNVDPINNATSNQGLKNLAEMKMPDYMQADKKGAGEIAGHVGKQALEGAMAGASTGNVYAAIISAVAGGAIAGIGDAIHNRKAELAANRYNHNVDIYHKDRNAALNESARNIGQEKAFDMYRNAVHFAAGGGALDAGNGVTEFTTGGSHESNPYGGIQQGIASDGMPNYVEEGEVKWDKENYIFPTRMKPTKKLLKDFVLKEKWHGKNYAEIAKIIQKTSEERENDPVARQTVDDMLGRLMQCHQEQKMQEEIKQMLKMIEAMPPEERAAFMQQMAGAVQNMYGAPQQQMPQEMPPQRMEQGMPMGEPQGMGMGYAPMQEEAAMPYEGEGVPMGIAACGGKLSHKFAKGGRKDSGKKPQSTQRRTGAPAVGPDGVIPAEQVSPMYKRQPLPYYGEPIAEYPIYANPVPFVISRENPDGNQYVNPIGGISAAYQNPYIGVGGPSSAQSDLNSMIQGLQQERGIDVPIPEDEIKRREALGQALNASRDVIREATGSEISTGGLKQPAPPLNGPFLAAARNMGWSRDKKTRNFNWAADKNKTTWAGATDRNAWKNKDFIESLKKNPALEGYAGPWDYEHQRAMYDYMKGTDAWKTTEEWLNDSEQGYERRKEYIEEHSGDDAMLSSFVKNGFIKGDKDGKAVRDNDGKLVWDDSKKDAFMNYFTKARTDGKIGAMYDVGTAVANDNENYALDEYGRPVKLDSLDGYTSANETYSFYDEKLGKNRTLNFYQKNAPAEVESENEPENAPENNPQNKPQVNTENEQTPYPKYSTWPDLLKAGIAFAGAFNRPDNEKANILRGWQPRPVDYTPIGDYQSFNPTDVNFMGNQIAGQQNRLYDIIGNTSAPSRAAALLAQQYGARNAWGDSYLKAMATDLADLNTVREFNRGTNQFNAQAANEAERVNFGLNQFGWDQTKAYADARDAASTLASTANSKAISGFANGIGEAYKNKYNNKVLEWMIQNKMFPGVTMGSGYPALASAVAKSTGTKSTGTEKIGG